MADTEEQEERSAGKSKGKMPKFALSEKLIKLLTIVIGIIILFGFVVTVSIITVRVLEKGTRDEIILDSSNTFQVVPPQLSYFDLIPEIRTATSDPQPSTVVVTVRLGYLATDEALYTELVAVYPRLTDMIRSFFSSRSKELLKPSNEKFIKQELLLNINQLLLGQVQEILFLDFQVIDF